MKRFIAFMLVGLMFVSVGCSQKQVATNDQPVKDEKEKQTEVKKEEPKAKPVEVEYFTSQAKIKDSYNDIIEKIQEKTANTVNMQVVPDEQYTPLLKTKLATKEVPDIFDFNTPSGYVYIKADANCVDLSNEPWVSRLVNPTMVTTKDGKIYSMPRESSSAYMTFYYNKGVFEKVGVEVPNTMEEFYDVCSKIKEAGITPIFAPNKESWTTQIFMTAGFSVALGDKAEDVYGKIMTNQLKMQDVPEFIKVLDDYKDLYTKGFVNENHMSATMEDCNEAIGTGTAAMTSNGEWIVNDIQNKYNCELGAFVLPINGNKQIGIGRFVQGMFIPKESKNIEAAKEILNLWSQPEQLNIHFAQNPASPAFNDVDGGNIPDCVKEIVNQYIATGNYKYEMNGMMSEASPLFPDKLWKYYQELVLDQKDSKQVLEAFDKDLKQFMTDKGEEGWK